MSILAASKRALRVAVLALLGVSSAFAQAGPEAPATTAAPEPAPEPPAAAAAEEQAPPAAGDGSAPAAWDYLDSNAPAAEADNAGDVDLAALGDGEETSERFPKLDIYGFADLTFTQPVNEKGSRWDFYLPPQSTFFVGNINLYIASQMSKVLRSLLEVRFTYLPHGKNRSGLEQGTGPTYYENYAQDYTDAERPIKLGAIEIERVHLEYSPVGWLSIVAGQWLTPYGIWNVDHGTPTTIDTHKPYIVGEEYLPERQTGLLVQGAVRSGVHRYGYNFGLSNGRGPLDSYYDMDSNKALTGHLSWQSNSAIGDLTVGVSGYYGRYTNSQRVLAPEAGPSGSLQLKTKNTIKEQYDEYSLAMDAKLVKGGFEVFSEVAMNTKMYTDAGRPLLQNSFLTLIDPTKTNLIQPDTRRVGGYVIGGYRFRWLGIMPFTQLQYVYLDTVDLPATAAFTAGLNMRPHESVTFKLHFAQAIFPGANDLGPGRDSLRAFATQVAWAF